MSCDKPISDLTTSEKFGCAWDTVQAAWTAVVDHPAQATVAEWEMTVFSGLFLLFLLQLLVRRRRG